MYNTYSIESRISSFDVRACSAVLKEFLHVCIFIQFLYSFQSHSLAFSIYVRKSHCISNFVYYKICILSEKVKKKIQFYALCMEL